MKRITMLTRINFLTSLLFARNSIGPLFEEHKTILNARFFHAPDCRRVFRLPLMVVLSFGFIFSCIPAKADNTFQDRRRDQFPVSPAHLVVPLPYSYPGIGDGFFLMGNISNVLETTTDFLAMYVAGDAGGYVLQFDEAPIMERRLYAKLYYQHINRAIVNQYDTRGMDNTGKYDYTLIESTLALEKTAEINLTFFDRRLNFLYQYSAREFAIQRGQHRIVFHILDCQN